MPTFGERLRRARREKFIKQKDVANQLNIAVSTLSQYENNKRHPSFDLLVKMSEYLSVSTDYLLGVESKGKSSITNNLNYIDDHIETHTYGQLLEEMTSQLVSLVKQDDLKSLQIFHELYSAVSAINVDINLTNTYSSIEDVLSEHLTHKEIIDQRLNKLFRHHIKNHTIQSIHKVT